MCVSHVCCHRLFSLLQYIKCGSAQPLACIVLYWLIGSMSCAVELVCVCECECVRACMLGSWRMLMMYEQCAGQGESYLKVLRE